MRIFELDYTFHIILLAPVEIKGHHLSNEEVRQIKNNLENCLNSWDNPTEYSYQKYVFIDNFLIRKFKAEGKCTNKLAKRNSDYNHYLST